MEKDHKQRDLILLSWAVYSPWNSRKCYTLCNNQKGSRISLDFLLLPPCIFPYSLPEDAYLGGQESFRNHFFMSFINIEMQREKEFADRRSHR